ncbi:hypothetical protein NDU88_005238 [Pleurodeles waltl]|uniref:Uncharacterized protein n=1 Tax=Pleurodeles waltl TaxID=8319 RepID=A0AAV7M9T9_PLEWA|nr:hypothetical protein NDU88_005238 [Pleurodeles waltl]
MARPSGDALELSLFTSRGAGGDHDYGRGYPQPGYGPMGTPLLPLVAGLRAQALLMLLLQPSSKAAGHASRVPVTLNKLLKETPTVIYVISDITTGNKGKGHYKNKASSARINGDNIGAMLEHQRK